MKKRVPTIQDVAREARVSASTVSNVLNRRWKQTSRETRERILEVARRLNYHPNAMAAALRRRSTRTIGVVVTNILNPFYTAVVRAIQDEARRAGYTIIVTNTDYDQHEEREVINMLRAKQVDGMLVVTNGGNKDLFDQLQESGMPVVLVDRGDPALRLDTVNVANEEAAENAVRYLLDLGHRRVAIVSGETTGVPTRAGRLNGYLQALVSRGITPGEDYQQILPTSFENGRQAVRKLLELAEPPSALFVTNTFLAIGALQAIRERGLKIPADVSFLMFDDPDWTQVHDPPITAVALPTQEIGARAFQLLETRIKRKRKREPQSVILPTSLIIRQSCAAVVPHR